MHTLIVAFCTFKRAERLNALVGALRAQSCPVPFEILAVNNNSPDNTLAVLETLRNQPGAPLRIVTETAQGIVPARNRALAEALDRDILVFIDDDELPQPGLLDAAYDAIVNEEAVCVGGRIEVDFRPYARPDWLDDEVAGFLGRLDHGNLPLWITDGATPIWSGNVAFAMKFFRENPTLRFDLRYNREGEGIGGGEDAVMFRTLLSQGAKIRYRPDMGVLHSVEPWRLKRRYFLKLHYQAGFKTGRLSLPDYPRKLFGIPPFLLGQLLRHAFKTMSMQFTGQPGVLRQAMNAAHAFGCVKGFRARP